MKEKIQNEAYELSKKFRRISPHLFMRKFKITYKFSMEICCKIWLLNHLEARIMAKNIESY